jgi:hypothetical protein
VTGTLGNLKCPAGVRSFWQLIAGHFARTLQTPYEQPVSRSCGATVAHATGGSSAEVLGLSASARLAELQQIVVSSTSRGEACCAKKMSGGRA